jgi:predicted dehydrogenase
VAAFVASVREGLPVRVGAEDALAAVKVAGAARTSHLEHRPVQLSDGVHPSSGGQRP